jgi:hypothetical protein
MTNQTPPEPPSSMPERRRRPATGVTFDEMIAIIVAFSTIGAILFWTLGGKNAKLANNLSLGGDYLSGTLRDRNLLASDKTIDTGAGFGSILSKDAGVEGQNPRQQDLKAENRRLAAQLKKQDVTNAGAAFNQTVNPPAPAKGEQKSFSLDAGAKLAPLAGVATIPALRGRSGNTGNIGISGDIPPIQTEDNAIDATPKAVIPEATAPEINAPEPTSPEKTSPKAIIPEPTAPEKTSPEKVESAAKTPETAKTAKTEPKAITSETTKMPQDVVPDYWAYPFVKQMRDKALVPELAKNPEFDPDALITRASMATLVSQAFGEQPKTQSVKKFTDVSKDNAIAKDIDQAVSSGFMQGYSDDEFKPSENIPRYQVLVTLATGLGLKPSKDADQILQQFGDLTEMPDWAKSQVAAAVEAGLVVNPPDAAKGALVPEKPATRGEVAAMIHQALVKTGKLKSLESEYIVKP